jgi:hypothetical protein
MVLADVGRDLGWEEIGAEIAGFEPMAKVRGGHIFMDVLQKVNAAMLVRGQVERGEVLQREARAADDDPFGEFQKPLRLAPAWKIEEAIRADEVEESVVGKESIQSGQGVDGVVGAAIGMGRVQIGDGEARLRQASQREHGDAVGEGRRGGIGFERLSSCGGEEYGIELEGVGGGGGDREVAAMGWVEGSAEESYTHRDIFSRICNLRVLE